MGEVKAHALWVPLYADDGQVLMVHGFYDEVMAVLCYEKSVTGSVYTLVVGTVGDGGASIQNFWKGSACSFCGVDFISVWHTLMYDFLGRRGAVS